MKTFKITVFSGAGISAESGLQTFRDSDGLWEEHRIEDVATPEAWARDPRRVLRFYDERRSAVMQARPNAAHQAIAELEAYFDVTVVTQNIDDLHERAGSRRVVHLHGEIGMARSSLNDRHVEAVGGPVLEWGRKCPEGSQMRPHIVWFGEPVPMLEHGARAVASADALLIIGTSLSVYPAAGLIHHTAPDALVFLVDPADISLPRNVVHIKEKASLGSPRLAQHLIEKFA